MGMYPTNTKLEEWLTTWLIAEVDDILLQQNKIAHVGDYQGMNNTDRHHKNYPVGRQACVDFIREHRPHVGRHDL